MKHSPIIGFVIVAVLLVLKSTFFIVPEGTQALVFQFGKIVREPETEAGLKLKIPFIQNVQLMEKRILNWDGYPEKVPTADKKYIIVDTTARYQIVDARRFRNKLDNIESAQSKIKNVLDSATRDVISRNNLVEAVRNTNRILDKRRKKKLADAASPIEKIESMEQEVTGEIESITQGRELLSRNIKDIAEPLLKNFGITLIDIQLRRIAYEDEVQQKVYSRMISERNRIAAGIRSVGKGELAKIRGRMSKDLQEIESGAYRKSQEIKGKAEAEAIKIYADSVGQDEDFYEFVRTLEAYENGMRSDSKLILSADSAFMKLLKDGNTK